jgi:DNA-binding beta-propeller fold protein YncE
VPVPLPFVLAAKPHVLPLVAPFAAIAIDAPRHRLFAADTKSVAVLDAVTGRVIATIRIGGVRSIAVEPLGGHVFAGTADGRISELDPDRKSIVRSMDAGGASGVLYYDSIGGTLYADGAANGTLAEFDATAFTQHAAIAIPGVAQAQLAPDPITRELYVALTDRPAIAIFNFASNTVRTTFPTPGLLGPRSVRFDDAFGQIVVAGSNGLLDVYDRTGTRRARVSVPPGISACELDTGDHVLACTAPAGIAFVQLVYDAPPLLFGTAPLPGPAFATIDTATHDVVAVRSNTDGSDADFERFSTTKPHASPSPSPH